jgi:hypothetical protein
MGQARLVEGLGLDGAGAACRRSRAGWGRLVAGAERADSERIVRGAGVARDAVAWSVEDRERSEQIRRVGWRGLGWLGMSHGLGWAGLGRHGGSEGLDRTGTNWIVGGPGLARGGWSGHGWSGATGWLGMGREVRRFGRTRTGTGRRGSFRQRPGLGSRRAGGRPGPGSHVSRGGWARVVSSG